MIDHIDNTVIKLFFRNFPNFVFEVVQGLQEYLILRKQGKLEGGLISWGGGAYNRMNIFVSK